MSKREGEKQYLVSVSDDVSHEDQVQHKWFSAFLSTKIPTVNITATSNSHPMSVGNTDDEEQVVSKAPIETAKWSPIASAPLETAKTSHSAAVPVVVVREPVYIE